MNCENICVRSSWQYSLWLERSRDRRKPGGGGSWGSWGSAGSLPHGLSWAPQAGRLRGPTACLSAPRASDRGP